MPAILFVYADGEHRRTVDLAVESLIQSCMRDAGFEYEVPSRGPADGADSILNGAIGVVESERATQYGYTAPDEAAPPIHTQMSNDPAFMEALAGEDWQSRPEMIEVVDPVTGDVIATQRSRNSGCSGKADAAIYGTEDEKLRYLGADYRLQNLGIESVVRAIADDAVVKATAEWSACMESFGYDFATPLDPPNAPWSEPRPSDKEIATAVADVECKSEVHLVATYRSVLYHEAEILEADNVGVLAEWTRLYEEILERITVLESG